MWLILPLLIFGWVLVWVGRNKAALILLFIMWTTICFFLLQGSHKGLYYLQVNSVEKIGKVWAVLAFAACLKGDMRIIKWFAIAYSVIMLYPFLPECIRGITIGQYTFVEYTNWVFFGVVLVLVICLLLYIIAKRLQNENT